MKMILYVLQLANALYRICFTADYFVNEVLQILVPKGTITFHVTVKVVSDI